MKNLQNIFALINKHKYIIAFILMIGFAVFLRIYRLDSLPAGLNQDEAVNGVDAYYFSRYLVDHHGNSPSVFLQSFNDWASPLLTYTTIPFVKIFGLSTLTIRTVTAIYGILSIFLFYLVIKSLNFSKTITFVSTSFFALSPFFIHLSRWAIPPSIVPFWLLLLLLLQIKCFKTKVRLNKVLFMLLSAIVASLLTYSYPTMKLFVPVFYFVFCLLLVVQKIKDVNLMNTGFVKKIKHFYLIFLSYLIYILTVSPIFILTLIDSQKYNARFASTSISNTDSNVILGFFVRFFSYLTPYFLFFQSDQNSMHRPDGFGLLNFSFIFVYLIGLFYGIKYISVKLSRLKFKFISKKMLNDVRKQIFALFKRIIGELNSNNSILALICFGILLGPVASSLTKDYLMSLRTVHYLVLCAIGLTYLLNYLISKGLVTKIFISLIAVVLFVESVFFSLFYFKNYDESTATSFNALTFEVLDYLDANQNSYDKAYYDLGYNDAQYIYYYFYFKPSKEDINFNELKNFKNKKYSAEGINLNDYKDLQNIKEFKYKNKTIWIIYKTDNNLWLAKKV